jgi:deoxyribonuclease-2
MGVRVHFLVGMAGATLAHASGSMSCQSPDGSDVDWWVILKLPGSEQHSYFEAGSRARSFQVQADKFAGGALANTLDQVYGASKTEGWIMYNDEPPSGAKDGSRAHAKGVLGLGSDAGFWLIHSTPRFPAAQSSGSFNFPYDEHTYGQSFMCLSVDPSQYDPIANGLVTDHVHAYDFSLPPAVNSTALTNVAYMALGDRKVDTMQPTLTTVGGTDFKSFFKNKRWDSDLWDDLVAPTLGVDMQVETWMRPAMRSCCSCDPAVVNVRQLSLGDFNFSETQDHSKWGVSNSGPWVCVGDINRMTSQRQRGGGATCTQSQDLADAFRNLIVQADDC